MTDAPIVHVRSHRCPDCGATVTYHDADQHEHGHLPHCEGAQVCDCPPGWQHRPDCPLVSDEGDEAA